jgi:hypothetical protein
VATTEQPEDTTRPPRRSWRARLRALPPRVWALIIAPVIPVVATALVTGWLNGSGDDSPVTTATPPTPSAQPATFEITDVKRRENVSLGAYLDGDATARERFGQLLGCEGAVFAVSMRIENATAREPQLTWSLRQQRGLHAPWDPPPAYDGLRRVAVRPTTGDKLVWVPLPGERESWLPGFKLYEAARDIPADPAATWEGTETVESIPLPPEDLSGPCDVGGS